MNKFKLNPAEKYVFIMGAGASKDDNLPIQDEILKNILKSEFAFKNQKGLHKKEYKKVSNEIKKLLKTIFTGNKAIEDITLEGIFNILETAITKNQNIGNIQTEKVKKYYDTLLEGIMFATLTDATLKEHSIFNRKSQSPYTIIGRKIYEGCKNQNNVNLSFITFNYDICLDRVLLSMYDEDEDKSYDVDFGIELGNYEQENWFHRPRKRKIDLLRPHGSINWLFCKSCGKVFSKISKQGKPLELVNGCKCYNCGLSSIEPYIVHPTNNRIYENKYIMQIWNKAETILQEADHWCFIGYSLPEADRYFSYLLSRIYNFRKAKSVKNNRLPRVSVVNINKYMNKHNDILQQIKSCHNGQCSNIQEIEEYFQHLQKGRDVFSKFGVYFDNIEKYECSFKEFALKYFEVS
ncbi:MAG: hypothetical protein VB017_05335 [Endomicrobiaceae bacterium]|nr:hypothetical protein [Endomicrobiaceae bacterium]